ncbi:hypothetical protein [Aphanothece sacrum]|uniref:Glycerophosphodiester phosphodiesterase n=1 Tax=Aphanothece sacrum FPU1 TaxID=1920663 RepID=A0A401IE92_APHSA|nr:hypothetical protein [Aphanothece sacrum]GBF79583.1 glycerophosphodiester phosphodiesterase [Aphanothece sacrum FPU1]GBF87042.1 glycerophosphodiester phosphodiesterase [Aphanothece sacrum FPU3]
MLLFDPTISLGVVDWSWLHDHFSLVTNPLVESGHFLAQKIEDPQILEKLQKSWQNFIKSGQVWALGIGFFFGWVFRTFTGS